MQNSDIQAFTNATSLLIPDTVKRRVLLPYLIGLAVGSFLTVKQGNDVSPMNAFNTAHVAPVAHALSKLNEEFIFDVLVAQEAVRSIYLVRSRIVNGDPVGYACNPEFDLLSVVLGVSEVLPASVYAIMKETGMSSVQVFQRALLMVAALKKSTFLVI